MHNKRLREIDDRKKEIRSILEKDESNNVDLEQIEQELRELNHEKNEIERRQQLLNTANSIQSGNVNLRSLGNVDNMINGVTNKNETSIEIRRGQKFKDLVKATPEERNLSLSKYIKGVVTGDWTNAEAEKRALTTTATGTLIPEVLSAEIIDLARDKSIFTLADVPIIEMTSNNMTISKVKKDPVFKFKQEGAEAQESTLEFESVELKSKTIYGYAYVSLEAIHSSPNLHETVMNAFSEALAQGIDNGMLYGQYNGSTYDNFAPLGIMNNEDIKTIQATESEGYDSIIKAIGQVRKHNGEGNTISYNAKTEEVLSLLKTNTGEYLNPPKAFENLHKIVSNQLKYDEEKGSDLLVFDPKSMLIGIQNNINFEIFRNTDECIKKGLVGFRIYEMIDCVVVKPNNICKITGFK